MAYRRLVAEALAALDEEASGRVVELGSRGSAPPAEPRGWRCADVGGWIRKHRAHLPESDAWDWYERVRRAINKLACDGAVHMYAVDRFRLVVPVADVTYALRVRCEDGETIPLIVPRSCDDRRLRALISRATGGRVPPERVEVEYPRRAPAPASAARASDALVESRGLRDGDEIRVRVVKSHTAVARAPSGPDAAPRDDVVDLVSDEEVLPPAARVARTTDPDRSPDAASAHEVIELEAEGEAGWNDDRDGWVNLVAGDETRDDDHRRGPPEQKTLPGDTNTTAAVEAPPNAPPPNAAPEVGPKEGGRRRGALETFASDDEADDAAALDPTSSVFSPSAAFVANPRVVALESESDSGAREGSKGLRFSGGASSDPDGSSSALTGSETASDVEASSDLEAASPAGRLHAQVRRFAASAGVSPEDAADRDATVRTIRESVARVYPSARVEVFGSGATGLALREADIDLVVLGVGPEASARGGGFDRSDRGELVRVLRRVEKQLRKDRVVRSACGIYTAKVPIIKACAGAYDVDISVGVTNGLDAVAWIRRQAEGFHALRPLVLVLKRLLKTHGLDDASTGGCGGYLLVSLVVSHLKQSGERMKETTKETTDGRGRGVGRSTSSSASPPGSPTPSLGEHLLGFLRRFGDDFDYQRVAVAANRDAGTCSASLLVVHPGPFGRKPCVLAEDPQELGRNITASAYRFRQVRALFRAARAAMLAAGGDLSFVPELAATNLGGTPGNTGSTAASVSVNLGERGGANANGGGNAANDRVWRRPMGVAGVGAGVGFLPPGVEVKPGDEGLKAGDEGRGGGKNNPLRPNWWGAAAAKRKRKSASPGSGSNNNKGGKKKPRPGPGYFKKKAGKAGTGKAAKKGGTGKAAKGGGGRGGWNG